VQGDDRLERAQYFYQESVQIAQNQNLSINWQYKTLTNVGHDFEANALYAMDLLY
jgi:pantothenate kinase type III